MIDKAKAKAQREEAILANSVFIDKQPLADHQKWMFV
jgi:hypothetical protein